MSRCVVTGSTGCLGMALTKLLLRHGHTVIALGRDAKLGHLLEQSGASFYCVDINDFERMNELCHATDVVFHCAALSSPWGRYQDFYAVNVTGTKTAIAATPANARFIHVSSSSVYYAMRDQYGLSEQSELPNYALNHYIDTKKQAELLVLAAHMQQNLKAIILRPRAIFGPYDRSILPRILRLYRNGRMLMVGNGQQRIDITYVDNVAEAMLLAADCDERFLGNIYNITNDDPQALQDLLHQVMKKMKLPVAFKHLPYLPLRILATLCDFFYRTAGITVEPPLTPYMLGVMCHGQTLDITKIKEDLGYKPRISIEQGLNLYADWVKRND